MSGTATSYEFQMSFAQTVADSKEDYESSVTSKWSVSNFVYKPHDRGNEKSCFSSQQQLRIVDAPRDTHERNKITERNHEA